MKNALIIIILFFSPMIVISQTLFTPSGTVGTSSNSNVGVGTSTPTHKLDVRGSGVFKDGSIIDIALTNPGGKNGIAFSPNTYGNYSRFNFVNYDHSNLADRYFKLGFNDDSYGISIRKGGYVGIGTTSPEELLQVNGNILLKGDYFKIIQKRSNVSLEHLISGHGQGGGLMLNAEYSGAGNPQDNATFSINPGTYNTSAGYLDFDGNGKRWSLFVSPSSSGIGNSVSFTEIAFFDLNSGISFSPSGNGTDFFMDTNGNIGIGLNTPDSKLVVDGKIRSEEVKVEIVNGPDYVFEPDYDLRTLEETQQYISKNKHLPEIPSAAEMEENGIDLGAMNMNLLKKVEELTLYLIEQNNQLKSQQNEIILLKEKITQLENQ